MTSSAHILHESHHLPIKQEERGKTEVSSSPEKVTKRLTKARCINTFLISCYGWVGFF